MPKPTQVSVQSGVGGAHAIQAWSPLELPNLRAWYRGDTTVGGASVTTWTDKKDGAYNLTGGVAPSLVAATINGNSHNVVRGNGTTQYLTEATMPHSDGEHIVIVMSKVSLTFGDVVYDTAGTAAGMRLRHGGTGDELTMHVGAGTITSTGWDETAGVWRVIESIWGDTNSSLLMRNYSTADDVPDTAAVLSPAASSGFRLFSVGGGTPGNYANDDIAEIIISSAPITGADYVSLKAYTLARYGIG